MSESAITRLRAAGLRLTKPRIAVLEVLDQAGSGHDHLTVAEVAEHARARLGSLSTQAVYDCLDALTAAGVVRRIQPAGHPARYESRVGDNHHHLTCRQCGLTTDVDCVVGAAPCLLPASAAGYRVEEAEVLFWGLCPTCADQQPAHGRTTTEHQLPTPRKGSQ
ncbi:Fur family transcriptional regulator [Kribbella sp. CA-293567]|uniref:Fur family transcriptional regulator n=1 Tax=Kribbella sp. CA-293567 TaxID=3002436 RepID=UPI0022DD4BEE|nr:Fur family transcriptional regulator [Kribbella sp. CA-293567]WBQ05033.1 Fur family transcriptional regulator [Kribbella sp. CA-293567]